MLRSHVSPFSLFPDLYRALPNRIGNEIPAGPGLYVIFGANPRYLVESCLYVGQSRNLRERVVQSQIEKGFRGPAYVLSMGPRYRLAPDTRDAVLKDLEMACIKAFFTITYGKQAPLLLVNRQHAGALPKIAWCPRPPKNLSFAIAIATEVLADTGLRAHWAILPSWDALQALRSETDLDAVYEAHRQRFSTPFIPDFGTSARGYSDVRKATQLSTPPLRLAA